MANRRNNVRKAHRGHYKKTFTAFPFEKHEEVELTIDALSHQGQGIGRLDHTAKNGESVTNWVVFVPLALPGEKVKVKITHNGKTNSTGELIQLLTSSEDRVEPNCKHFGHCGGCHLQHLSYPAQLQHKTEQIKSQLNRLADIDSPINEPISTTQIWNYRAKITPRYDTPEKGKIGALGFTHHSHKNTLVDIHHCQIAMEPLNQRLLAEKKQLQANAKFLKSGGELLLRMNAESVETHASNAITQTVGDLEFHFLAGDFFQNNPFILESFTQYVADQATSLSNTYLLDAYCGCGLFSLSLADRFEHVTGIEVSASSADWARFNAKANGIANATFITASAEQLFKEVHSQGSDTTVVIDPPRAGCDQKFLKQLLDFAPSLIVYVSCDPATQMRDLTHFLSAGYTIRCIQPFDLFPQTRHMECVITLERSA